MVNVRADASFIRNNGDGSSSRVSAYFHTPQQLVNAGQPLDIDSILSDLNNQVENWNGRGSGFTIDRVLRFVLCISTFRPLHGSTYIPTPEWLKLKQCLINVQNTDDSCCFMWAILSALYPATQNPHRVSHYRPYKDRLNVEGLEFPLPIKQIPLFEKNNPSISINVLYPDGESRGFCVLYLSPHRQREHHVNLLLLDDPENPSKHHFTWIKHMSALVCHRTNHKEKVYVCNSCLHPFYSQQSLEHHVPLCRQFSPQQMEYPNPLDEDDSTLKFRSKQKQHPIPFYLVADFESFLAPVQRAEAEKSSGVNIIDEHVVSGFCVYRVTPHEQHQTPPFIYSGPEPMSKFYDHVMSEGRDISRIVRGYVDMLPLTSAQSDEYDRAVTCANCGVPFTKDNKKVHHHCHISGNYLFPACNRCNLQLKPVKSNPGKETKKKKKGDRKRKRQSTKEWAKEMYEEEDFFVPIIFHNLRNYDSHLIIKHFQRKFVERRTDDNKLSFDDVIITPLNTEKYLQFQIGNLRFLDSFQFLSSSLDNLVQLLLKSGKQNFTHTSKHFGDDDDLVFAKGVYPYAYMSSRDKFAETQLPPIGAFHDNLKDDPLKQEDYDRAQQVWSKYGMQNMRQYHDHYLLTDVLLLSDVFEHFRQTIMLAHNLDCLHFITLPSLAWAMALKHTEVELDLLTDPEAYLMIEHSLRGGIATISQRYASANNPLVEGYDDSQPSRYITYLDANSLYATAQSEPLPVGNFRFLDADEVRNFDLDSIEANAEIGYIVECDLEYPEHLHDHHNDYPMAPEHLTVTSDMLSPFAVSLLDPSRPWRPTKKLVPNLLDKTNYVAHYRNLQLYTKHGLKITKIHKILSFTQKAWLKPWIDLCNAQRRAARSDFESDLAKLQANAIFGKTIEQVRHRRNIRLIADASKAMKAVAKPTFRQSEIVNSDLVMVRAARTKVKLNKPIAVGFAILEISKHIMYSFYYDHLKDRYRDRCSLLFTDTDSLCCEIQTADLYADMGDSLDLYDTSNFSSEHPQYSESNRRVLGKFKSETGSIAPAEFVGLKAKMYSLHAPKTSFTKVKGVQKHYVRKNVRHQNFVDVLRNVCPSTSCKFRCFRSTNHVVNTVEISKLCLCPFDDKRYLLDDGVHTMAYGHRSITPRATRAQVS